MITRLNPIKITETVKEDMELMDWIWNSHWWIEYYSGYYKCKWCGVCHTSMMAITIDFPLCSKNPCLLKFKTKHTGK